MKTLNYLFLIMFSLFGYCNTKPQVKTNALKNSPSLTEKKNQDFSSFLKCFYDVKLPLNYSKEIEKVKENRIKLKDIKKEFAMRYLHIQERDLFYFSEYYNYDTDEKNRVKVEDLPVGHFKYSTKNFIVVCYRQDKGPENDTLLVYLCSFNYGGIIQDKLLIGGQFTGENDWISSVIINEHEFKVFKYELNKENYIIKNNIVVGVKDKDAPLTTVQIEDYKIDVLGKIAKTGNPLKLYLQSDISKYKSYHPNSDDPINKY